MGKTQITAEPGTPFLQITREFDAPKELVFRAYTEPDLLVQWLGPRGVQMRVDRYEVRDGGTWRYTHADNEGNEYGFHGVFHGQPSVEAGIVQTFEFEGAPGHVMLEWMTFEERDGKTLLIGNSVAQSVEDRDAMVASGMESGVVEGYERLDDLLSRLKS
jgi:uncharacterized protein YndB with AHSA1/START domain